MGRKLENPEKNHLTHPQAELAELGLFGAGVSESEWFTGDTPGCARREMIHNLILNGLLVKCHTDNISNYFNG